jgi:hypothetical protein
VTLRYRSLEPQSPDWWTTRTPTDDRPAGSAETPTREHAGRDAKAVSEEALASHTPEPGRADLAGTPDATAAALTEALFALKAVGDARRRLPRGTAEYDAALAEENRLIRRVREFVYRMRQS